MFSFQFLTDSLIGQFRVVLCGFGLFLKKVSISARISRCGLGKTVLPRPNESFGDASIGTLFGSLDLGKSHKVV